MDAKTQAAILVAGVAGALYLAGYDPLGIVLGWIEMAITGIAEWFAEQVQSAAGGLWDSVQFW